MKMWLLIIPLLLVGALVVAAGLAAGLVLLGAGAFVLHHMAWVLVLVGVWLVMRPRGGRRHRAVWSGGPGWRTYPPGPPPPARPTPSSASFSGAAPAASTAPPASSSAGTAPTASTAGAPSPTSPAPPPAPKRELPIDVKVKVEQIRHKADVLLGYAERFPPFSHDLHLVRQTAADYLPKTVETYLALPGDDDPVVGTEGKTALQELREQLELLDKKLDDVAQDLQRRDVDRLLANRRFLEDRFRGEPSTD